MKIFSIIILLCFCGSIIGSEHRGASYPPVQPGWQLENVSVLGRPATKVRVTKDAAGVKSTTSALSERIYSAHANLYDIIKLVDHKFRLGLNIKQQMSDTLGATAVAQAEVALRGFDSSLGRLAALHHLRRTVAPYFDEPRVPPSGIVQPLHQLPKGVIECINPNGTYCEVCPPEEVKDGECLW